MLAITNMRSHCCITFLLLHSQYYITNICWLPMLQHWQLFLKLLNTSICLFHASLVYLYLFHLFRNADVVAIWYI